MHAPTRGPSVSRTSPRRAERNDRSWCTGTGGVGDRRPMPSTEGAAPRTSPPHRRRTPGPSGPRVVTASQHWDGSHWVISPLAEPETKAWYLDAVETLSQSDVWAVGFMRLGQRLSDGFGALVEHWDGSRWSVVATPALPPSVPGDVPYARLDDVAASGPNDVWVVGETSITSPAAASDTLVEHWDGAKWSVASTPDVASPRGVPFDHLFSAAVVSPADMWAAGSYGTTDAIGGRGDHPLVVHWGGIRWSTTSTPPQQPPPLRWSRLGGIAAASPNAVWAVGSAGSFTQARGIIATWDGRRWTPSSLPGGPGSSLNDVAVDPTGGVVWAVGSQVSRGAPERTLIEVCR